MLDDNNMEKVKEELKMFTAAVARNLKSSFNDGSMNFLSAFKLFCVREPDTTFTCQFVQDICKSSVNVTVLDVMIEWSWS